MPRKPRDEVSRGKVSIGLLAGIWGDDNMRVFDIQLNIDESRGTSYDTWLSSHSELGVDGDVFASKIRRSRFHSLASQHPLYLFSLTLSH